MNQKDLGDLLQDCLLSINMEKKSENKHWNIPQISKNEVFKKTSVGLSFYSPYFICIYKVVCNTF